MAGPPAFSSLVLSRRLALGLSLLHLAAASGVVSLNFEKRMHISNRLEQAKGIYKRQTSSSSSPGYVGSSVFDVQPWSEGGAYYTNISVGTPPQTLTVILDTGSSDLYFDAATAQACQDSSNEDSCRGGTFHPSSSSTYEIVDANAFQTAFGDGSSAGGDYSTDTIGIGEFAISGVQFGVATSVNSTVGFAVNLMGIGYSANEAAQNSYANVPDVLHQAGIINSRLFSIFLNYYGVATGTVLFGGIDTAKYTGQLTTYDIAPAPALNSLYAEDTIYQFLLPVTAVSATASGKTTTYFSAGDPTQSTRKDSLLVLLDTGSAAWTVPQRIYDQVSTMFSDLNNQTGTLSCSHQKDDISFTVQFGGSTNISVPVKDLVVPVFDPSDNKQMTSSDGTPLCALMLSPDSGGQQESQLGFLALGDSVLRSMYAVFDLDNGQISLAQAATNPGSESHIKVVSAGPSGVANAVGSTNINPAPTNSYPIAAEVTGSKKYTVNTVSAAEGTATGAAAVPESGVVAGGFSGGGDAGKPSKGAAVSTFSRSRAYNALAGLGVMLLWSAAASFGLAVLL